MSEALYEAHSLTHAKLPFIFHRDLVRSAANAGYNSLANWHSNVEILYFISGSGSVSCDMCLTPVRAGDLFIINSNSLHAVLSDTQVRYYCLILDEGFCIENDIDTGILRFQNKIADPEAVARFTRVIESYATRQPFYNAAIRSAVLALLVYLAQHYTESASDFEAQRTFKTVENIKVAMGYIRAHFDRKLSLDAVANEVGLSRYHFAREFKRVTGTTFVEYVNLVRCDSAKKMLQSGAYSVGEVCAACGFENPSYFSKVFKRVEGVSPLQLLKRE